MTLNQLSLSLQFGKFDGVAEHRAVLSRHKVTRWIRHALSSDGKSPCACRHRGRAAAQPRIPQEDYATNVLTFDYTQEPVVTADLVLCAPVVAREAVEQNKEPGRALRPPAGARHLARPGVGP